MEKKKILIGMSGGVDSSVAAFLMHRAGFDCVGATMRLFDRENGPAEDTDLARSVANRLGIPFHLLDFRQEFAGLVIREFIRSYESGQTPNPCIVCNRQLKFRKMLDAALAMGCHGVASGHYARIRQDKTTGRYLLYKAMDPAKDQSYFLACLDQQQLSHVHFPLGELTKQEVRSIAEEQGFLNARKRDSQDICFVPDGDYAAFMERYTGKHYSPGNYLDTEGNVVGTHQGAIRYTLGQRKGLGIAMGQPVYVCGKNMAENTVTIGPNEALFSNALRAKDWNWYPFPALSEPVEVMAKVRHSQRQTPAVVYPEEDGFARVEFREPQRAVTPGQAVVLYRDDMVIGGGTITGAYTL